MNEEEILEGYVVDIACVRRYPKKELTERARKHTAACALTGHCIESGYALISPASDLALLDTKATLQLADLIRKDSRKSGIQARIIRHSNQGAMETISAELV